MENPTLIPGPDGELYLVPPNVLEPYRLTAEEADLVQSKLAEVSTGTDSEVQGYRFDANRLDLTVRSVGLDRFDDLGGNPVAPVMGGNDTIIIVKG